MLKYLISIVFLALMFASQASAVTLFSDNFNRTPDEDPIAGTWAIVTSAQNVQILSNAVTGSTTNERGAAYEATAIADNQWAQATLTLITFGQGGIILRASAVAETYYSCRASPGNGVYEYQIYKIVAGSYTAIGNSAGTAWVDGDVIRCEIVNYDISIYRNGVLVLTANDGGSSIASGKAGMDFGASNAIGDFALDDFSSGDFTTGGSPSRRRGGVVMFQ